MSLNALAEAVRQGKELLCGTGELDSSGELAIATPFATIDAVVATVNKATAPTTLVLSSDVSGNDVTIKGWKATASNDVTLVASDANEEVDYIIIGRRRT